MSSQIEVGPYTLVGTLGHGAVGTTHLAVERGRPNARHLAIRVPHRHLWSDFAAKLVMFEEARVGQRLRHPNIVQTVAVERAPNGVPYVVMEYASGPSLETLAVASRSRPDRVGPWCWIIACVCDGLDHAHRAGVIHGDLTSADVRVGEDGVPRLLGLEASPLRESMEDTLSNRNERRLRYAGPEMFRVGGRATAATDVYSAAVCLWEGLAGSSMFEGLGTAALMQQRMSGLVPSLRSRAPDVPAELEALLGKALDGDPEQRLSVRAFADGLREWCRGVTEESVADWIDTLFPVAEDGATRVFGRSQDGAVDRSPIRAAGWTIPSVPSRTPAHRPVPGAQAPSRWPLFLGGMASGGVVVAVVLAALMSAPGPTELPADDAQVLDEAWAALEIGRSELAIDLISRTDPSDEHLRARAAELEARARRQLEFDLARGDLLRGDDAAALVRIERLLALNPGDREALDIRDALRAVASPLPAPETPPAPPEVATSPSSPPSARGGPARPAEAPVEHDAVAEVVPLELPSPVAAALPITSPAPALPTEVRGAPGPQMRLQDLVVVDSTYALHGVLVAVETALVESGLPFDAVDGVTDALQEQLVPRLEAGQRVTLYPRAMYLFLHAGYVAGEPRKSLRATLRRDFGHD